MGRFASTLGLLLFAVRAAAGEEPLRVLDLRENSSEVGRYEKFELAFGLSRPVGNPFDPEQIRIDATFAGPDGKAVRVPAFYHQDFVRRLVDGREELTPVGAAGWKVRFAPTRPGPYSYFLTVRLAPKAPEPSLVTGKRTFTCVPSKSRGFVRVSRKDPAWFEFDDGSWFYPIGHGVRSPSDDTPRAVQLQQAIGATVLPDRGTFSYDGLFKKMAESGENFAEVWLCAKWLDVERLGQPHGNRPFVDYDLAAAWKLDQLLALADQHGLYLQLVIEDHAKWSTWCDPEWLDNRYNERNGGFLPSPQEFFRNAFAREIYKKFLRYLAARWGYSTRNAGFDLCHELDLVGDSYTHDDPAAFAFRVQWLREMTDYLKQTDPGQHLLTVHVSTSYSRIKPTYAMLLGIDYLTCDAYPMRGGGVLPLCLATAQAFQAYGKPGLVTEFGGSPFGGSPASLRADLHAGLWASYLTHAAGSPLFRWPQLIESDDLYWNFKALAAFHAGEDRRGQGLVPGTVAFPNPHGDLAALALRNQRMAYVWVYSRNAVEQMPALGLAPVFRGQAIALTGLLDGSYAVEVWDTREGKIFARLSLTAANGSLTIPLPDFRIDCAIKIKRP